MFIAKQLGACSLHNKLYSFEKSYACTLTYFFIVLQMDFEELEPELVTGQVTKYAKTVYQMEKGLPSNSVVPLLKAKVDAVKDTVSSKADLV